MMEPSFLSSKGPLEYMVEQDVRRDKDPKWEGISQGAKAGIIAAPIATAVQALRGKSPGVGALVAGLGAGALAGISAAAIQKYKNLRHESELRYHLRNMVDREPTVALPGPEAMRDLGSFTGGFQSVYNPY